MHCSLYLCSISVVVIDRFIFIRETKKWLLVGLDRWPSYTVMIVQEFTWVDSALVI